MEEKTRFDYNDNEDFDFIASGMLEADNDDDVGYISEDADTTADDHQHNFNGPAGVADTQAYGARNALNQQISIRTVSSISTAGPTALRGLDKRISERSNYSIISTVSADLAVSQDHSDENSHGVSLNPDGRWSSRSARSALEQEENSHRSSNPHTPSANSMKSPRSKRRGLFSSRKETNCSTHAEEKAALEELYVLVGEEHQHKVEVRNNKQGFVVHLEIRDAELDGPAPECIGLFSQLEVLILEGNCISGPIPAWLPSLFLLQELNLAHNEITGIIPDGIANLQSLTEMDLSGNQLSGSLPDSIGELKALVKLSLQQNDLSGVIPDSFCGLSLLTDLNISNCCLTGHLPHHIGRMHNLTTLLLFNNQLVGALPESLGDLHRLEQLNLCNNHFKGHLPESIGKLTMLQDLNLFHNEFNGSIPSSIGYLSSLKTLSLASNHFRGPFPESICNITMLEQLNLSKNVLSGQIPAAIERMPMLTALNLAYNRFKGSIPESIGRLLQLTELHLDHNSLSGKIPENIGSLLELTALTITHNQLSGEIPFSIGNLTALVTVHLSSNQLTGVIPESLGGLVSLQTIHLSHNQLTGSVPESIVNLTALCELDLSFNRLSGPIPDGIVSLENLTEINLVDTYLSGYDTKKEIFLMSCCGIWAADQYGNKGISIVNFADWSPSYYRNAPLIQRDHHKFQIPLSLISLFPHTLFLFPHEYLAKIFLDSSFYSHIRKSVFMFLRKLCEAQNPCIFQCLVILWYLLMNSSKIHVSEEADLVEFAEEIIRITNELFKCPSMDKLKNVQRLILEPQYCMPIQKNLDGTFDSVTYWNMAHIFEDNSPIHFCLEHNHKFVLALTQITNITDQLFWGCVDTVPNNGKADPCTPYEFSNTEFHSLTTYKVFACPRYTPAVMFFIEGLSKLYTLVLVSFVCTFTYGQQGHDYYNNTLEENCLVVMLLAQVSYEVGQLASCGWSLSDYFGGLWNILDVMSCFLLLFWLVLIPFPEHFYIAKCSVALSAIPLALLQLQYMSLIKTLGLLVLMIQSMMVDVMTFIVVYLVSIYGFTVSFRALFYTVNDYSSTGTTFVTLFQSTLGEFNFGNFDNIYETIGVILLVLFLILTNVLLVNLLIAQMSSTYNRIIFKSREEWTFIKAMYVQDNLLLNEKNPFCMLPPPLNTFTIVLYPLHYWALSNLNISVAGTAADFILGFYLIVPRFLFYWWKAVEAAFIDLEDDDDDYQERYHTFMKLLVMVFGRGITRFLVLVCGLPFGLIYVLVSSVLRAFYVVVRVKPLDEDGDGSYEINFYLDAEDDEESEAGDNNNNTNKMVRNITPKNSSEGDPDKPYTFADALPDAFEPTPDMHQLEEEEDPEEDPDYPERANKRKQNESKGAKRIKKALNAKQSFVIDADAFDDPSNLQNQPVNANGRRLNRALLPKLSSKMSFYEKGEAEGASGVARKQSFSVFDIAGVVSKDSNYSNSNGKKMSPKTSFNLNDGLAKLLPRTSFNLSDGGNNRNHDTSPGIGYGKSLSRHSSDGSKNNSRNNSSNNLLRSLASAFGANVNTNSSPSTNNNISSNNNSSAYSNSSTRSRPGFSAMNSLDYIPTGFNDDDFLTSTNNSTKHSNAASPDNSGHSPSLVQSALLKISGADQDASPTSYASYVTPVSPVSPVLQPSISPFRINVPHIDTSYMERRASPADTARSHVSHDNDNNMHTSRTNNSNLTNEGPVHSFDENDVLPDNSHPKRPPAIPTVATHFAGKLLNKMKQKAVSAAQHVHLPTVTAREGNLSPVPDIYEHQDVHHSDVDDESSYDSDGKKKAKKKHKPALFDLFGMKKVHSKHHHAHSPEHFVPPDSYSDGEEQTPHFAAHHHKIVKAGGSHHSHHDHTSHGHSSHGANRERTHSASSAVSGRDTPTDPPATVPAPTRTASGSGVSKLFGLVTKAMNPNTNNHPEPNSPAENSSDADAHHQAHNRRHSHHDHLHKENSANSNNNNNSTPNSPNTGNIMSTLGDLLNGTKKPNRRGSATSEVANSDKNSENVDEHFGTGHEDLEYQSSETESYRHETTIDTDSQGDSEFDVNDLYSSDGDTADGDKDAKSLAIAAAKKHALFTPEDILRMFPANENEQNKLEIEEEIRKLKVSSEKSVADATEEMKNDFKLRLTEAMNEIRSLREALTGVPCAPIAMEGDKGNNLSSEKMKRLASKKSFANTSGGDLNSVSRASKKESFHVSRKSSRMKMDTLSGVAATTSIAHNMAIKGKKNKDGVSRHNSVRSMNSRTQSNNSLKDGLKDGLVHSRKSSRSPAPEGEEVATSPDKDKPALMLDTNESSGSPREGNANGNGNGNASSPLPPFPTKQLPKWPPPPTPPTPAKPVVIPRDGISNNTATNEAEVQQMKSDLQSLQGDMSEIKKMLGSILGKI